MNSIMVLSFVVQCLRGEYGISEEAFTELLKIVPKKRQKFYGTWQDVMKSIDAVDGHYYLPTGWELGKVRESENEC